MNFRRILGFIILIIGILIMIFAYSIKNRTEEGKQQVTSGQKKVDSANSLFSMSPYTKPIGKGMTSSSQREINEGKETIAYYEKMAKWLKIGGIVVIIAGVVTIVIPRQKRRR